MIDNKVGTSSTSAFEYVPCCVLQNALTFTGPVQNRVP